MSRGKYICIMGPDTIPDKDWVENAVHFLESRPDVGAIQCKIFVHGSDHVLDAVGDYLGSFGFLVHRAIPGKSLDYGQFEEPVSIFGVKSAAMFVRKDVFSRIEGFDEEFFIFVEETDLCWRILLNGQRIMYLPTSIVYHKMSQVFKKNPERSLYFSRYYGCRNYITMLIKNLSAVELVTVLPLHLSVWMFIAFLLWSQGKVRESKWVLSGLLWNLVNLRSLLRRRSASRSLSGKSPIPEEVRKHDVLGYYKQFLGWWTS